MRARFTSPWLLTLALPLLAGLVLLAQHWPRGKRTHVVPDVSEAEVASADARASTELASARESSHPGGAPAEALDAPTAAHEPALFEESRSGDSANAEAQLDGPELVMSWSDGSELRVPASGYRLVGDQLTIYAEDGSVEETGRWDGKHKQGPWQYFEKDGTCVLLGDYVDGLAHGNWLAWHSNGNFRGQSDMVAGKFHGQRSAWNEDGSFDLEASGEYVAGVKQP